MEWKDLKTWQKTLIWILGIILGIVMLGALEAQSEREAAQKSIDLYGF